MVHKVTIRAEIGRIENEYFPNEARRRRDPSRRGEGNDRDSAVAAEFLRGFMLSTAKVLDQIFRGSEGKHGRLLECRRGL
jgi:hypothetical protein